MFSSFLIFRINLKKRSIFSSIIFCILLSILVRSYYNTLSRPYRINYILYLLRSISRNSTRMYPHISEIVNTRFQILKSNTHQDFIITLIIISKYISKIRL
ncbi:hypothetical protein LI157_05370 [Bacteroides uniformis]|nr:hypothetical protein [Bacteroides uniformis]MCB7405344.1 hypothetical protein [Bacteroides uniformis]